MMEFIATNFNLPTIIVAALVFGALGWVVWHTHKHGGGCSCGGDCSHCKGCGICAKVCPKKAITMKEE